MARNYSTCISLSSREGPHFLSFLTSKSYERFGGIFSDRSVPSCRKVKTRLQSFTAVVCQLLWVVDLSETVELKLGPCRIKASFPGELTNLDARIKVEMTSPLSTESEKTGETRHVNSSGSNRARMICKVWMTAMLHGRTTLPPRLERHELHDQLTVFESSGEPWLHLKSQSFVQGL